MIEAPPKLRISRPRRRPSEQQIAAFQDVPTGHIVDAMYGGGTLCPSIRPLAEPRVSAPAAAGPALTADCGAADVLAVFAALQFARPGDMIVSAFAGHTGCAAGGDGLIGMARNCGVAGFVTDGPLRDLAGLLAVGLPVWCAGVTPGSPHMSGPGTVGQAIQIGGQQVATGDMIVADADGVVVVPFDRIDEVIGQLGRIRAAETAQDARVAGGMCVPDWVGDLLGSDAVEFTP